MRPIRVRRNLPLSGQRIWSVGRGVSCRGAAALFATLILSIAVLFMVASILRLSTTQTLDRGRYETYKNEFAAAEKGLNKAYAQFQFLKSNPTATFDADVLNVSSPTKNGMTVTITVKTTDPPKNDTDKFGTTSRIVYYQIVATAKDTGNTGARFTHSGVTLSQNLEFHYEPIWQYAIFYDPILEIGPGAAMVVNGRVHSNSDTYVETGATLDFQNRVTVAGSLYHGRLGESGMSTDSGDVTFYDGSSQVSMKRGSGWLDSLASDWASASQDRWKGYVADDAAGVPKKTLPIPGDPHVLIERTNSNDPYSIQQAKFANQAGLRIFAADSSGNAPTTGLDQNGQTVQLTYHMEGSTPVPGARSGYTTKYIVTKGTFYDQREKKTVSTLDVDIANLKQSGVSPSNGIVYVSNADMGSSALGSVRLKNGSVLPTACAQGFSIASDCPVYVWGDYNTTSKIKSMVAGDAINILSNNWADANSDASNDPYSGRTAGDTTINSVFINGIVKSASNNYSGGVENYFRLLENWGSKKLTFSGSLIELWESQRAKGAWKYGSPIYDAPNRIWSWDNALGGLVGPPGVSPTTSLVRKQWSIVTATN